MLSLKSLLFQRAQFIQKKVQTALYKEIVTSRSASDFCLVYFFVVIKSYQKSRGISLFYAYFYKVMDKIICLIPICG